MLCESTLWLIVNHEEIKRGSSHLHASEPKPTSENNRFNSYHCKYLNVDIEGKVSETKENHTRTEVGKEIMFHQEKRLIPGDQGLKKMTSSASLWTGRFGQIGRGKSSAVWTLVPCQQSSLHSSHIHTENYLV
ncbi:hypothetical protein UPYG_G00023100 [Umbra pygmaea]|uniref:Uncharacterized protein n=1 Tax=Umbra pygmaea TaxID=75934 RepID=A0ABD0XZV1_UMBPY